MNKDLSFYIKKYQKVVPQNICDQTILDLETIEWNSHTFYDSNKNLYYSNANEPKFTYEGISTTKEIMNVAWKQIEQYVLKDFNFSWWNSWQGFNLIKFNKYDSGTTMTEHCDHIHDMFDGTRKGIPILTVVGLLNSNFSGGEFVILEDNIIELTPGDIIIFPSVFLFPHKVNPINSGVRYSFVSWVW
jgi:hypothetical protein